MKFLNFVLPLLITYASFAQKTTLYDLSAEHKNNPIGIDVLHPRLSWKLKSTSLNVMQTAYSIRVATANNFSKKTIVWESGKINSDESVLLPYQGPALISGKRYYWQVKVWEADNKESAWSESAFWEMGLLKPDDWKATWIEPLQDTSRQMPGLVVRREFTLRKKIAVARAYVTSHGFYELYLNGKKAGDEVFTPGWTAYQKRLQYQVYDVTGMLQEGQNAVGAMLGDGWYRGALAWENNWGIWGKKLGLLCQLRVQYMDGTEETIISDKDWKGTQDGPVTMNGIYNGESYDARKEMKGWANARFDDSKWKMVNIADYSKNDLVTVQTVPVKRIEELIPVKIFKTPKGTLVADIGQNMVGWIKLKVKGTAGTTVTIRHAEVLDKYGEFYTENLRAATATAKYTLKGGEEETYEPRFSFFGFRYVAIDGYPGELKPGDITGIVIHSDMKPTGTFESSSHLLNQLQHNIQWGQKGNFVDVPTDCPQRDERLGWTGDAQAFVRTAAYNMDVAGFFTKWLKDLTADQYPDGQVPFVIPDVLRNKSGTSAGWGDVATIAPMTIYQVFGDKQILETQYPTMKSYVEYIRKKAGNSYLWKGGSVFGDWLFYKSMQQTENDGYTNPDMIATMFYGYSSKLLAEVAGILGKTDDEKTYKDVFEKVKTAFNKTYVTPEGHIASESQTSYVLALNFGLLPEELRPKAVQYLVEDIKGRGNHLSTGFLGTPYLCHVLSQNGHTDVAYDLLLQETFPSWLYPVKMGATTIWERWDGQKTDSTFQDKGMNSFNHYAYGAIGDWMYRVVAGIEIGKPGYKHILIQPQPDKRLSYAKASFESAYGQIVSGWEMKEGKLIVRAKIPANTTATITLPGVNTGKITCNGTALSNIAKDTRINGESTVFTVGSGEYVFEYNTSLAVISSPADTTKLVALLLSLAAKEKNPLLKRHFASVALMANDKTNPYYFTRDNIEAASNVLNFFENEGAKWETYTNGPRPLIMAFTSPTDNKNSFYWLFLPKDFDPAKKDYSFYLELHGSGGGTNNNPRQMLFQPLQPEVAGVTSQGYRKEGLFVLPWGRGDRGYRDTAETDIWEVIKDFDAMFTTNPKRQYLYGFSMGASGTLQLSQKSTDRWSAIGAYSGGMRNASMETAEKFRGTPVWLTWGELETRLAEGNRTLISYFKKAGVEVKWTEVKGVGHNYLGKYQEDLMNWLLLHEKK
ncbi:MAG: family 78 glycoside hydrolase catalytic domain [Ferruginibacter sp.]